MQFLPPKCPLPNLYIFVIFKQFIFSLYFSLFFLFCFSKVHPEAIATVFLPHALHTQLNLQCGCNSSLWQKVRENSMNHLSPTEAFKQTLYYQHSYKLVLSLQFPQFICVQLFDMYSSTEAPKGMTPIDINQSKQSNFYELQKFTFMTCFSKNNKLTLPLSSPQKKPKQTSQCLSVC